MLGGGGVAPVSVQAAAVTPSRESIFFSSGPLI